MFELVIAFLLGWFLSHWYLIFRLRHALKKIAEKMGWSLEDLQNTDDDEDIAKLPPMCVVERIGDQLFLYNKHTNAFYCQADTLESLAEALYANKKIDIACITSQDQKFWFVKGKIETVKLNES
jgi:hypothetical protein